MEASGAGRLGRGDRPVRRRAGQTGLLRRDDGVVRVQRRHAVVAPRVGGNSGAAGEVIEGTVLPVKLATPDPTQEWNCRAGFGSGLPSREGLEGDSWSVRRYDTNQWPCVKMSAARIFLSI